MRNTLKQAIAMAAVSLAWNVSSALSTCQSLVAYPNPQPYNNGLKCGTVDCQTPTTGGCLAPMGTRSYSCYQTTYTEYYTLCHFNSQQSCTGYDWNFAYATSSGYSDVPC